MQTREVITAPPLKLAGTRRPEERDPSTKPSPLPTDLDTALEELVEGCCIDRPERLTVERVCVAIAELVATALLVAGAVVLAQGTILS